MADKNLYIHLSYRVPLMTIYRSKQAVRFDSVLAM